MKKLGKWMAAAMLAGMTIGGAANAAPLAKAPVKKALQKVQLTATRGIKSGVIMGERNIRAGVIMGERNGTKSGVIMGERKGLKSGVIMGERAVVKQ